MSANPQAQDHRKSVRNIFDAVAAGYDNPSARFFPFCADRLMTYVKPDPGTRILDAATGTGVVAVAFAQAVGPGGRVHGIDISPAMLARAESNIRKMQLSNVDLHEMDAGNLDFKSNYFHNVVCSYGLFFIFDMQAALRDWVRVLRPGGKLAFTCFEQSAFQPMLDNFVATLQEFGVQLPEGPFGARRIKSLAHCRELLDAAGLDSIETEVVQIGYHLKDEHEWWEVVQNTAMNALYQQLPVEHQDDFRQRHLSFAAGQAGGDGLWLDVSTRFASGIKPAR